jgi:predicted Zn-dependent protease
MMWSEEVRDIEAAVAVQIVQELITGLYRRHWPLGLILPPVDLRAFGTWVLQGAPEGSPYWGTQWYIEQSYEPSVDKLVGSRFLSLVRAEPWQRADPHYDLAIVAQDLIASDDVLARAPDSYVLGATVPGLAAVISIHRLRRILGIREWQLALRRLVLHYFGHVIGLPAGPYASGGAPYHCSNVCVMRDARNAGELLSRAEEEEEADVTFCQDCSERLKSTIMGHHFHRN